MSLVQRVQDRINRFPVWLSVILTALSFFYMVWIVLDTPNPTDLKYFWIAGNLWLDGVNVYTEDFHNLAVSVAITTSDIDNNQQFTAFLYAPHVWLLSVLLGSFDYDVARFLLGGFQIAALVYGTFLVTQSRCRPLMHRDFSLLLLLAATTIGTAMSISMAQFGVFIYLGIAAFIYGICRRRSWATVLALILLTLKPNIGLVFVAFALVYNRASLYAVLLAGLCSLLLAAPAILPFSLQEVIAGYLSGSAEYPTLGPNTGPSTTGLINIYYVIFGSNPSNLIFIAAAAVAAIGLAVVSKSHRIKQAAGPHLLMACLLSLILLLVPQHLYDLTLLVLFFPLVSSRTGFIVVALANLVIFRVHRVSELLGMESDVISFRGSFLASIVFALVFCFFAYQLSSKSRELVNNDSGSRV